LRTPAFVAGVSFSAQPTLLEPRVDDGAQLLDEILKGFRAGRQSGNVI